MSIKIEMLRCFCEVAQSGNLNDAASRLGRTPSALSMSLKQFEDSLGAKLFEGERKNQLTALGQQIYGISHLQIRNYDEAVRGMENLAKAPRGLIRIASIPSLASAIFTTFVEEMRDIYPDLQFELRDADTPSIMEMLTQGQIDLGIASGRRSVNGVESRLLFSDRVGLVCSKSHRFASQTPSLQEVFAANYLANNVTSHITPPEGISAPMVVHNSLSLIAMLGTGNWVSILPQSVVDLAPHALTFVDLSEITENRDVTLYVHQNTAFPEYVKAFAERVVQGSREGAVRPTPNRN